MEHESDGNTNCNWCTWYNHQRTGIGTGGCGTKRTNGDHPNFNFIKIEQNTEKSPVDLRRLADTQTPMRNYYSNADAKNSQKSIIIIIIMEHESDGDTSCNWCARNNP